MISKQMLGSAVYLAIKQGATYLSEDVYQAFAQAIERETGPAKTGLQSTLKSLELSRERGTPACPDTGWPMFYFKIGNEAKIEGGMLALEKITREMVARATYEGILRKTMKHPLTGFDPGNNIGENIPWFTYRYVPGDTIEVTYAAKGGGSEVFGGTRYRMIAFSDGMEGIKKFIVDAYIASARAGAVCPPGILGVGIGGTANVAANIAKEAACLRVIGSHHPDPEFAKLEEELRDGINTLGIGHMGAGGCTSVFAVHVEYAYTHIAGIAVATSTNCCVTRRGSYRIYGDGRHEKLESPNWFEGR